MGLWVVMAVALLVHASGLGGAFTFDDQLVIVEHPVVQGEVPLSEVFTREWMGKPLGEGWSSSYRPLTTLSFAVVARLGGESFAQHLINWLLYAGLCGLVWHTGRRLIRDLPAFFAALAFAVLPLHVENVASLVGRADILAALFGLLAFRVLDGGDDAKGPNPRMIALGVLAYLAALLSKESVALLPGLILLRVIIRARHGQADRAHVAAAIAVSLAGVAYIVPRQIFLSVDLPESFLSADNLLREASYPERLWGGLAVWGHYLVMGVVAHPLCSDHTWGALVPPSTPWDDGAAYAWLGLATVGLALWDFARAMRRPHPPHEPHAGLIALAASSALLIGHFVIPLSVILAERLALWPSIFVLWALGAHVHRLFDDTTPRQASLARVRRPVIAAFALLGVFWASKSALRSLDWRDNLTLFRTCAEDCPAGAHNRFSLGFRAAREGLPEEAVWHVAVAAALRSQYPKAPELSVFAFEAQHGLFHDRGFFAEALPTLPRRLGVDDAADFWRRLAPFLASQGFAREAQIAATLAQLPPPPSAAP